VINFDDIYSALQDELTEHWETGKTSDRSSFKLKNKTVTEKIQSATGADIEAQFWMSKGKNNINFEFANDVAEYRELRMGIASSFRNYIFAQNRPEWLMPSRGSTVAHVTLAGKDDSTTETSIKGFYRHINSLIYEWAFEADLGLLIPQANTFLLPGKMNEIQVEIGKIRAIARMVKTAKDTVAGANGQVVLQRVKEKENRFPNDDGFTRYVANLIEKQKGLCAITGLALQFSAQADGQELQPSLDRIDSNGHYEPGNLQIVCRFVNRWKSNGNDEEFRRLIALVRSSGKQ
jgi:hypothetical protein